MATRRTRKTKRAGARVDALIGFDALAIEGGLLSPEWLSQVAQLKASQQAEADYDVPRGLNLRDEIGRYWRVAQAAWADFSAGSKAKADPVVVAEAFLTRLLKDGFGFTTLVRCEPALLGERLYPVGFSALDGRVPVVIAPAGLGLDVLAPVFGDGTRRRSAFGLVQEYLNAQDGALWGLVTDGVTLRIVRDNASLTRPAWIEVDVARLFTEERYADFAALWLLMHASRFGRAGQPVTACPLEVWRTAGREEGTRAREHLRRGVEDALLALGQGFLSHPDNTALRTALHDGSLTTTALFNQLLRLVYRLIFLLTVEERGLLHPDGTPDDVKTLYAGGYSLRRLRERSVKRSAHDRFVDLWQVTRIVTRGVAQGEPRLGLPALAGLFAPDQCQHLDGATLDNRALLTAMFKLSWLKDDGGLARVNWRDMGPEELGSVYESLLELVPQVSSDGRGFAFAGGDATKGNARKTSGSYYTPDSLVQVLLDSALEPVIADTLAKNPQRPVEALLELSIVDPACGSGHFLLAAARRLATHVARLQAGGTPSAAEYRHALRQVVGRCIYGVDLNPMAVELCKVSLWMEAVEPGLPLTFLNAHIQHGNALLGTTPELMKGGIPDAAWEAIEGDDKKVATALKKRNKEEGRGLLSLALAPPRSDETAAVAQAVADLEAASDADLTALSYKEGRWSGILDSAEYRHQKQVADAWCAAFVWPKQAGVLAAAAPTVEVWRRLRDGQGQPPALTTTTVNKLAEQYKFCHWHLQFPQVFAKGGFDVALGNPPWERVKLQEQEFFASRSDEIATAPNASARKKLIAALPDNNPAVWAAWCAASREAEGQSHFVRDSGRYPLCGKGDVNTYALFAEHNRQTLNRRGRAGFIVPSGIAMDETTKEYFQTIVSGAELASFFSFENEEKLFATVHNQFKFALLTIDRSANSLRADLLFFARQANALMDKERRVSLSPADFLLLNPNTRTCPTFRSRRDAEVNLAMYRQAGVAVQDASPNGNRWNLQVRTRTWHMAEDSEHFRTSEELASTGQTLHGNFFVGGKGAYAPLLEAKMVYQYDHRFGTYERATQAHLNKGFLPQLTDDDHRDPSRTCHPYYWVDAREMNSRLDEVWPHQWLLGWRDITNSVSARTLIASIVPRVATGDTFLLAMPSASAPLIAALYANLCSYPLDYAARQKVGGVHLKYHVFKQLPVLGPNVYSVATPWFAGTPLDAWLRLRVLELTYTAWDLEAFAHDVGYVGPPFRWDPQRRLLLRCELDAAFFHLYGLSRDDTDYVMETFPIVKRKDEAAHGDYRTKRVILEMYDAMAEAQRTATPYQTRLDPPPADPRLAHPESTRPPWAKKPS